MGSELVIDLSQVDCTEEGGLERLAGMLRDHGIKATTPRIRILCYLNRAEDHVNVETIFSDLRSDVPSLSKTTVYNTLMLFKEKGLVSALTISSTEQLFELERGMHHHLLCRSCGRIYDIDISCPFLGNMLHGEHKVEEVHGYFKGTCAHCLSADAIDE